MSGAFVQEIVENSPIGAQATGSPVSASDDDDGDQTALRYEILSGNIGGVFRIAGSGKVEVARASPRAGG